MQNGLEKASRTDSEGRCEAFYDRGRPDYDVTKLLEPDALG